MQGFTNLSCSARLKKTKGLSFLRKGGATYVTRQEGNWTIFSCEHNKFLGF